MLIFQPGFMRLDRLLYLLSFFVVISQCATDEYFEEELLVRPLSNGRVMAHFQFTLHTPRSVLSSAALFPHPLAAIIQKYDIREMHLQLGQSRWNHEAWGVPILGTPIGAEFWSWHDGSEKQWTGLTHALSALFGVTLGELDDLSCAQVNGTLLAPLSEPRYLHGLSFRHGMLPREPFCTENLTPWLLMLPCHNAEGLATLLDPLRLFDSLHAALGVHLHMATSPMQVPLMVLTQTLTIVLDPRSLNWTVARLFAPPMYTASSSASVSHASSLSACPLAAQSRVFVDLANMHALSFAAAPSSAAVSHSQCVEQDGVFSLCPAPAEWNVLRWPPHGPPVAVYPLRSLPAPAGAGGDTSPLADALEFRYAPELYADAFVYKPDRPVAHATPVLAHRFIYDSGGKTTGRLAVQLVNRDLERAIPIVYRDVYPPAMRVLIHTAHMARLDYDAVGPNETTNAAAATPEAADPSALYTFSARELAKALCYRPAGRDGLPATLELRIVLPSNSMTTLSVLFEKAFLHIDAHPLDAHRGFDIAPGQLFWPIGSATALDSQWRGSTNAASCRAPAISPLQWSPSSCERHEDGSVVEPGDGVWARTLTDATLLAVPLPDFSMPYNVSALAQTVLVIFWGSAVASLIARFPRAPNRTDETLVGWLRRILLGTVGRLCRLVARRHGRDESETPPVTSSAERQEVRTPIHHEKGD